MPLTDETLGEIDTQVRSGFESRERVIEIFCEEMYAPGDLDPNDVSSAVDAAIQAHEQAKTTWPEITDCERLDRAFVRLLRAGGIPSDHPDIPGAINGESRGLEARPIPFLGHRGDVEHMELLIGEIADVKLTIPDEQTCDDFPGKKSRV